MEMGRRISEERGSTLSIVADILGIVTALFALWEVGARLDIIPGRSPVQRAQRVIEDISDDESSPVPAPTISQVDGQETQPLEVPTNVSVSGGCDGFTLTWDPVQSAERYFVERDGFRIDTTTDTEYQFSLLPDGQSHEYRIRAGAPPRESDVSEEVTVGPC
jgi:hypothetical protein